MMMTTIANITLLATALLGLCAMMCWDLRLLQQNGYSTSRYYAHLQSSDLITPKRLTVLAVLMGCLTTMAQASWMVVMLLAAVLAALAIAMLLKRHDKPLKFDAPIAWRFAIALLLSLLAIAGTFLLGQRLNVADTLRPTSMLAVMILAISPLLTMLVNCIIYPFEKHPKNTLNNDANEQETEH